MLGSAEEDVRISQDRQESNQAHDPSLLHLLHTFDNFKPSLSTCKILISFVAFYPVPMSQHLIV